MKYDDASWHSGGDFPSDLPESAGATHTGMFFCFAIFAGLASTEVEVEDASHVENLRARRVTPGAFFLDVYDGKLTDETLSERGNAFAQTYFDFNAGLYLADYESTLAKKLPTLYHVADSWANFDRLRPILDQRLREWAERS